MAFGGIEVWHESCHWLQADSSSVRFSCPTTGTLIALYLFHCICWVWPCAKRRLCGFFMQIEELGVLDEAVPWWVLCEWHPKGQFSKISRNISSQTFDVVWLWMKMIFKWFAFPVGSPLKKDEQKFLVSFCGF